MASILKVRDADGTVHEIYALQGKSAYQYAVEGGYTGTEEEFAAKLADMPISSKPAGKSYLTFSSPNSFTLKVNDATKHWDGTLEYFASDKTWTVWDGTTTLSAVADDGEYVLYLRGTGNTKIGYYDYDTEDYIPWVINGTDVRCNGNIETLLDYATVEAGQHPTMADECFIGLFKGCIALSQAPDLSATTLADYCYDSMFRDCTSLTQAPALPATTLASNCYYNMFRGCTALTQAPELPAMTMTPYCYYSMFRDCASLTQAPALPATTLVSGCYQNMFYGCTSLTQAPALPATTLAVFCYMAMFYGCTSLTQAPDLPAMTLKNNCYAAMLQGCTSLKLSSTQTGEYTQEYRIPSSGDGVAATDALADMFTSTGGTFTGTPAINTTYYLSSDNMIVRETEIDTLNGYVGSMIDVAIAEHTSNPLNITGATVGQIAKITAVDENGKPTAWEAADMAGGSAGGQVFDEIVTLSEAVNEWSIDVPEGITDVKLLIVIPAVEAKMTYGFILTNGVQSRFVTVNWGDTSAEKISGVSWLVFKNGTIGQILAGNGTYWITTEDLKKDLKDVTSLTSIGIKAYGAQTFPVGTTISVRGRS